MTLSKEFLVACREGNIPKVKECIEKGVDVNVQDKYGASAALIAIEEVEIGRFEESIEILKILSQVETFNWNLQDKYGDTAALTASEFLSEPGYLKYLQLLLQNQKENIDWNVQSSHDGNTVAMRVASHEYVDCLNMLS